MMHFIWAFGVAVAAPATTIDFDAVTVEGQRTGPSIALVTESTRDVCPDTEGVDSPGWVECVVNLSYSDIKSLCSSLGPEVVPLVRTLLSKPTRYSGFDNDGEGESMMWRGCFYNSRSGGRVETFQWRGTGSGWIVTDAPSIYGQSKELRQTSLSVFDGYERSESSADGPSIALPATFAYLMRRTSRAGSWNAVPSSTNQDEINSMLKQSGYHSPYCGSEQLRTSAEADCAALPRLAVVAVSPTMMAVQSFLPKQMGYLVTGIFWRSETGFDIAQAAE